MSRTEKLADELHKSLLGDPWHGASALSIIDNISYEEAVARRSSSIHTIFEMVFHITGWMEEVLNRLEGKEPSEPARGDWPTREIIGKNEWEEIKNDFYNSAEKLIAAVKIFPEESLDAVPDKIRVAELGTGFTYEGLIWGVVQHTAYHMGQVSLLKKISSNR